MSTNTPRNESSWVRIRWSEDTGEVSLEGDAEGLRRLVAQLSSQLEGEFALASDGDPAPYGAFLQTITWTSAQAPLLLQVADGSATITGAHEHIRELASLADFVADDGRIGNHVHVEPQIDDWVHEGSLALVVILDEEGR